MSIKKKVEYVKFRSTTDDRGHTFTLPKCPTCGSWPTYNVNPCPYCAQQLEYPDGVEVEEYEVIGEAE